jgi:hypothetical protein
MDLEYDLDEPPTASDDPNRRSTSAHGVELFGELVGYEMFRADLARSTWSMDGLGYTDDPPHVYIGSRVDNQLHPPDNYTHSLHTDSWEDGLQEIEDFDWSADKENEQCIGEGFSEAQGEEDIQTVSGPDALGPVDQDNDHNLVLRDVAHLHLKVDPPIIRPADQIRNSMEPFPSDSTAYNPKASETNALRPPIKHVGSDALVIDDQEIEVQDAVSIDDISVFADTGRPDVASEMEAGVVVEQGPDTSSDTLALQQGAVADNIITENQIRNGLEDTDVSKASTIASVSTHPDHDSLSVYEPNLKVPPQIFTAPEIPVKDTAIESEPLAAAYSYNSHGYDEAIYSVAEASDQLQTQEDGPRAQDQLHDNSMITVQPVTDTLRSPSEGLSKVRSLSYSGAKLTDDVPEITPDPTISLASDGDNSTSPKSPGALSRVEEDGDGRWQAQLRNATNKVSSDGFSELLPPGYRDRNVDFVKPPPEITNDEVLVRATPPLAIPSSKQQLENSATLLPLPSAPENHARGNERSEVRPAETYAAEENAAVTQLAYRLSKPLSPFNVEPANARAEDHVTAPDLENSNIVVAVPKQDPAERTSSIDYQVTIKDVDSTTPLGTSPTFTKPQSSPRSPGLTTPVPAPKVQTHYPCKRSRPTKKTNNASETESDAPPKKKARRNVSPKPRASRARKPSEALEDQDIEPTPSPAKTRRGTVKSNKEAAYVSGAGEDFSASIQQRSTSKLGHSAQGGSTEPSRQAPITDESDNMAFASHAETKQSDHEDKNADVEEYYSKIKVRVTPSKHVPSVENVPSTPRSRPRVSKRELQGLNSPMYRERPSMAKRDTLPIARQLFKSDTPYGYMSSTPTLGLSPAAPVSTFDLPIFAEVTSGTMEVAKLPVTKSKETSPKTKEMESGPTAPQAVKKTSAARPIRKPMVEPVEVEEYDLSSAPNLDTTKPLPLPDHPSTPRFSTNGRRTTRTRGKVDKHEESNFPVEDSSVVGNTKPDHEDLFSDTGKPEDMNNESEEDDDDFKDYQETIKAPDEQGSSDDNVSDITPPPSKKPRLKNKSLLSGNQNTSQSNSRTSTSALSIPSSKGIPTTNKYGFKPSPSGPRTRQVPKAAAVAKPALTSKAKAKTKVPAKRRAKTARSSVAADTEGDEEEASAPTKGKTSTASTSVTTVTLEPAKLPSVRQTRRASAMAHEIKHAREEKEREAKEKVQAEAKAKLRKKVCRG